MKVYNVDNAGNPFIYIDETTNRLYRVNQNNQYVEVDQNGNPVGQAQQGQVQQPQGTPVKWDANGNPTVWRDNYGALFTFNQNGQAVAYVEQQQMPMQQQQQAAITQMPMQPQTPIVPQQSVKPVSISYEDMKSGNPPKQQQAPITQAPDVSTFVAAAEAPVPVKTKPKNIGGYIGELDNELMPLYDEEIYSIGISVNDKQRTFKFNLGAK